SANTARIAFYSFAAIMGLSLASVFLVFTGTSIALAFFSAASVLVAVPTAVQVFAWIGTIARGTPQFRLPMLHVMGFFSTFVMGGLTGVMLAVVPFNWQAHDTAFVTAHLHYVLIGGFVFPMMAAVSYWMPLICGRWRVRGLGEAAFWLILVGFHGTFFIMHLTGLLGMPRRIDVYPDNPEWVLPNLVSSIFGMVMSAGFALYAFDIVMQWLFGRRSRRNPWGAPTLDWAMPLPAPSYNFASLPGPGRDDADALLPLARGEGLLPGAPRGHRETLVVEAGTGRPVHVAVLPGNTLLPLATAATIGSFFALMLAGLYWLTPLSMLAIVIAVWRWGAVMGTPADHAPVPVAPGLLLPVHWQVRRTLAHGGAVATLVANGTLFASLLFGVGFLSVVAPGWPAPPSGLPAFQSGALAVVALAALVAGSLAARGAEEMRAEAAGRVWAFAGVVAGAIAVLALAGIASLIDDPRRHARDALRGALLAYGIVHAAIAGLLALRSWLDACQGRTGANRRGAAPVWRLWQDYTLGTTLAGLAVVALQEWA
ncbi:MAG: cbb3-type cytochrome c oxidase subunit I, partial [Gemmobacter sp.]